MTEQTLKAEEPTTDMGWKYAYWILLCSWILGAALTMGNVRAGFFSSYLSDLTYPPWFYILLRGHVPTRVFTWMRWFGHSPRRAGSAIFLVGVISEVGQRYGFPTGTYDPWDIVAYAVGLLICYGFDRFHSKKLRTA